MAEHEDDFDEVNEILEELENEDLENTESPVQFNIINVKAEGVYVHGVRQTPVVITFASNVERDPERDAAELETKLAHLLDDNTFKIFCDRIFRDYIQPKLEMMRFFESETQKLKKRRVTVEPEEEGDGDAT